MKKLLYISSNDGTDTRINKEVRTLSKTFDVLFLGVAGDSRASGFLEEHCFSTHVISGKRNHPKTLIKQITVFLKLIFSHRIHSVHVVNEQILIIFWPFLFFKHTVLDLFDSLFMRHGIEKEQWTLLKRIIYAPCNRIIVTDEARKKLMPEFLQKKLLVVPNYPFRFRGNIIRNCSEELLNILYFGWLGLKRGGNIVKGLLESGERIQFIMLGWFADEEIKALIEHPRVDYRGVIPQQEALQIAAAEADYILCLYQPSNNLNVINASPNKIYDGIQTETPIIINHEVKVASLVEDLEIGIVIPSYFPQDYKALAQEMINKKNSFDFPEDIKERYTWERVEERLILAHKT